jgi:anti-anti-sigma factor
MTVDEPIWSLQGPDGQVLVVQSPPNLTHETGDAVRACVEARLPPRDDAALILDMSNVRLISSIGIAALLQIDEHCRLAGAPFRLAGLPAHQVELLGMLRLEHKFPRDETIDDALAIVTH